MPPETPRFWQEDGWYARLLAPLSCLYYLAHKIKSSLSRPYTAGIPVFCVGGVVAGGSGKTPTLHAFLDLIAQRNLYKKPVILLRGYGGRIKTATVVDLAIHTYKDVGDEALLHAQRATTIISANRAKGAKLAEQLGADIILMDDGLQNSTLVKTASILVLDSKQGFGNNRLLPAGPLREPLEDAVAKVAAIIQIGEGTMPLQSPILKARITGVMPLAPATSYIAFAGLGRPKKFHDTLHELGLNVTDFIPFPDHHPYNDNDMKKLKFLAEGATLVTTAKDFVRIPVEYRAGIEILPVKLDFDDPDAAAALLKVLP